MIKKELIPKIASINIVPKNFKLVLSHTYTIVDKTFIFTLIQNYNLLIKIFHYFKVFIKIYQSEEICMEISFILRSRYRDWDNSSL